MPETGVRVIEPADVSALHLADGRVEIEAGLAAANIRAVARARRQLDLWLPHLNTTALSQTTDSATVQLGPVGPALAHSPLIDGDPLAWMVNRVAYGSSGVRMAREGEFLPPGALLGATGPGGRSFLSIGALAMALEAGYTAVFDGIDLRDESSMRLAETVERVFGCAVNINAYLSTQPTMSFGSHWDDQEVIIVQLLGSKRWAVEQPQALSMNKTTHQSDTSGITAWEGTLRVGSCLYVPRGWGHKVASDDGMSLHYTITIKRTNGIDTLGMLIDRSLRTSDRPFESGREDQASSLVDWLREAATDERVSWAVAMSRSAMPSRSTQRLSALRQAATATLPIWIRSPISSGWIVVTSNERSVVLSVNGHHVELSGRALSLLADHGDGALRWISPGSTDIGTAVELCRHGIVQIGIGTPPWGISTTTSS